MSAGKYGEPWRWLGNVMGWIVASAPIEASHNDPQNVNAYSGPMVAESVFEETGDRIVACVNACEGIPTERLALVVGRGRSAEVGGWRVEQLAPEDGPLALVRVDGSITMGTELEAARSALRSLGYKLTPMPPLEMPGGERDEKIEPRKEAPDEVVE